MRGRELEEHILGVLDTELTKEGWMIHAVFDGEECTEIGSLFEAIEIIYSVGYAELVYSKGDMKKSIWLVPGEGSDLISDHHINPDDFGETVDRVTGWIYLWEDEE